MPSARPKSALVFGAIAAFIIYQYSAFLMPTSKLVSAPVVDQSPPASLFPIESPAARSQSIPSIESASSSQSPKASESPALSASPVQRHAPIPPYQNKEGQLSRNWMMYGNIETGHYFLKVVYAFDEIGFEDFGSSQSRQKNLMNLIRDGFELVKGERLLAALGSPATVACVAVFGWDIVNGELSSPFPDCPRVYQFSSSTREGALKTIPDMFFDGWPEVRIPSYVDTVAEIRQRAAEPWQIDKLFWIGHLNTNAVRPVFLAKAASAPNDMEIVSMGWGGQAKPDSPELLPDRYVSLPDHTKYRFLLDFPGVSFSGRLKYMLHMRRLLFLTDDRIAWDYSCARLEPWKHYVPVSNDASDVVERIAWARSHPEDVARMVDNLDEYARTFGSREHATRRIADILMLKE